MRIRRVEKPFRVFVGLVPTGYLDTNNIAQAVRDGMVFCGTKSRLEHGARVERILVRPSVIKADPAKATSQYTHPEVLRPVLGELLASVPAASVTVAERCMPPFSTWRMLKRAHGNSDAFRDKGYFEFEHLFPGRVSVTPLEETLDARYQLSKGSLLTAADRDESHEIWRRRATNEIRASRCFKDSDFTVYCPKIKVDLPSGMFSGAIRQGAPHDNWSLLPDHAICDALEVSCPQLIVSDAIIVGVGGNRLTQTGQELGAVLVSNNALAHDWVAAKMLNLDPMGIRHLRMAAERGWGPSSFSQIELGGAGAEGLQALAQKASVWDMAFAELSGPNSFATRIEADNSGTKFQLEILSGQPVEPAGSHGLLLDWLYENYESPKLRTGMAKWPQATVCIGTVEKLPSNYLVFAIGDRAIASIAGMTSTSRTILSLRDVEVCTVQLKNERRHLIVRVPGEPPSPDAVRQAFSMGSLGRMTRGLYRVSQSVDTFLEWLRSRWRDSRPQPESPAVVLTSRMPHNQWWALQPIGDVITEAEKAADAP